MAYRITVCLLVEVVLDTETAIDDRASNEYGGVVGMKIDRRKESVMRKHFPVPLRPPQIQRDLA
jgi:hypothetical protein